MSFFSNASPSPETPRRWRDKLSAYETPIAGLQAGLSPASSSKFSVDSGVDDLFDSPPKIKSFKAEIKIRRNSESVPEVDESERAESIFHDVPDKAPTSPTEEKPARKLMPEDPFANEHSKILFEAIDQLLTCGSHEFLSVPQVQTPLTLSSAPVFYSLSSCLPIASHSLRHSELTAPSSSLWEDSPPESPHSCRV